MKTIFKLSNKLALAGSMVATVGLVAMPITSYALGDQMTMTNTDSTTKTSSFCTELPNKGQTTESHLSDLTGKVSQARTQQNLKIAAEDQKIDQEVSADRQKADTERSRDVTKLEARAKTDAEKQAVQTYLNAVQSAISIRRAAYDAARQTFRSGVQAAITSRHATITTQLNTFQTTVSGAISTAEANCSSSPNSGTMIRQALQANLKSARQTFQGERKSDDTIGAQVKQLAAIRKAAFKAADQAFQTSLATARQALKQAFGKSAV